MIWDQLKAPFPADKIHWRIGQKTKDGTRAMVLAYIDARDVQDRLDEVVGPDDWQCRHTVEGGAYICHLGIWSPQRQQFLWRSNGAEETKVEAKKGGLSDAFKRAAVMWGVGRYLYDIPTTWVQLDSTGKFTPPSLPSWALPDGPEKAPERPAAAPAERRHQPTPEPAHVDPEPPQGFSEPSGADLWGDSPDWADSSPSEDPERAAIQDVERDEEADHRGEIPVSLGTSGTSYWDISRPECMFNQTVRPDLPEGWNGKKHVPWLEEDLPTFPFGRGKMEKDYGGHKWSYIAAGDPGGKRYKTLRFIVECFEPPNRQKAGRWYEKNLAEHETLVARCKACLIIQEEGAPI